MKVVAPRASASALAALTAACRAAGAFRCHHRLHPRSVRPPSASSSSVTSALLARRRKGGGSGGGRGFGPPKREEGGSPKYSIEESRSYGPTPPHAPSNESYRESLSSMSDFFNLYGDWKPLFRSVMSADGEAVDAMASSFLSDVQHPQELWGISTLEQRNPWRLLPSKPESESSLQTISRFLDEWQQSLLDIPLDSIITGDNDLHFLEEGRRTIAVTRFHVLDEFHGPEFEGGNYDWEAELFRTCWSELAHLSSRDDGDTGSLILLPDHVAAREGVGLDRVRNFVEGNLVRPIRWLGREDDWEIAAMERGGLAVRLLYKLGDIPDLSERDGGSDEDVRL